MRLQKYLAHAGVASRRRAEEMILRGEVVVNGKLVRELGSSVTRTDLVTVRGRKVQLNSEFQYFVLHKPLNMMTTMRDPQGRRTIVSLLPKDVPRIVPVGRLDYDTSGVLLLTNDGELAHVLTHPKFGVQKTYRVTVRGRLQRDEVARLREGISFDGVRSAGAQLRVVAARTGASIIDLTIHEGKNRQVRRMFEELDHPVMALVRMRFGPLRIGELPVGAIRPVTEREIAALRVLAANKFHANNDALQISEP
ncbi:MAG: rRNA pseudouridine synthase [Candidatus Eremiobacteraeota bacterium]|nr:rRNA pseudouridine synthase [Candidatus Eremiobacteraeota bacterium]